MIAAGTPAVTPPDGVTGHGSWVEPAMSGSEGAQRAPARGKRGRGRKATEVTEPSAPAAKAQKAVDGDVAQQSATPWRDVLMGNSPDDRHTIQALIAQGGAAGEAHIEQPGPVQQPA